MQNVNSLDNGMKKKMIDGITKCNHKSLEKQTLEWWDLMLGLLQRGYVQSLSQLHHP